MARTRTYRVTQGRIQFKCPECQAKRLIGVPPNVRRRSIKCHKCSSQVSCILNRRVIQREQQFGRVALILYDGRLLDVDLFDVSLYGVGFEISARDLTKIAVGNKIQLKSNWNPLLLDKGGYKICSIKGRRVGAEKVRKF
jgi:hypothetical protein